MIPELTRSRRVPARFILSRAAAKRTTRAVDTQAVHVAHFTAKLCAALSCCANLFRRHGSVRQTQSNVDCHPRLGIPRSHGDFYFGLGVGLAFNPLLGTLLWILALAVAGLNLYVILRRFARR